MIKKIMVLGLLSGLSFAQESNLSVHLKYWLIGSEHEVQILLGKFTSHPLNYDALGYSIHPDYIEYSEDIQTNLQRIRGSFLKSNALDHLQTLALTSTVELQDKIKVMHGFAGCSGLGRVPKFKEKNDVFKPEYIAANMQFEHAYFPRVTDGKSLYERDLDGLTLIEPQDTLVINQFNENLCNRILELWHQCETLIIRGVVTRNEQQEQAHGFFQKVQGQFERSMVYLEYTSHEFKCSG